MNFPLSHNWWSNVLLFVSSGSINLLKSVLTNFRWILQIFYRILSCEIVWHSLIRKNTPQTLNKLGLVTQEEKNLLTTYHKMTRLLLDDLIKENSHYLSRNYFDYKINRDSRLMILWWLLKVFIFDFLGVIPTLGKILPCNC